MPIVLVISKHAPENCPAFNKKAEKAFTDYDNKADKLMKKYRIKRLGEYTVPNEHIIFGIFEAPSVEVLQKLMMEPEVLARGAYETTEVKLAMRTEEQWKMIKGK